MNVILMTHTPDPELVVAQAAKTCYSGATIEELREKIKGKDQAEFIKRLAEMGHASPMEHVSFTFGVEGVSRALLAQITRHRIASFSVQSQRYVENKALEYVIPDSVSQDPVLYSIYVDAIERAWKAYDALCRIGIPKEDARFVLPNAATTRFMVTMNARELWHFFRLRCCNRAQWEIQELAWNMLRQVNKVAPNLFRNAGAACLTGKCPEGEMSCGKPDEMRELREWVDEYAN